MATQADGFNHQSSHQTVMTTAEVILDTVLNKPAPGVRNLFVDESPVSTNYLELNAAGPTPTMNQWIGARPLEEIRSYMLREKVETWSAQLQIKRLDLDGGSEAIARAVGSFMNENSSHLEKIEFNKRVANAGAGPLGYDGVATFSGAHPHGPGGATQSNTDTLPFNTTNVIATELVMASYRKENGESLGVVPKIVVCGPKLRRAAEHVFGKDQIVRLAAINASGAEATTNVLAAAGISNVMAGSYQVIIDPRMVGTYDDWWYMIDPDMPKVMKFGLKGDVRFIPLDNWDDPARINADEYQYYIERDIIPMGHAWQGAFVNIVS